MEVPSEVLPKLVCENCDGYLSRGPVHLMENVKYRCGRCLPSEEEQGTRNEVYEELAKLMTFPCRYREKGCPSKVPFMENESHEEACPYREYICPIAASGQCEWTGIRTELLQHCQQEHPDSVVENPCKFTHNITQNSLNNYILWTLRVLFLIQTKICTASRKIYHSVRLIGDPAAASNYKYTLCILNKKNRFYKDRQVAPRGYLALQLDEDSSIQTDITGLLAMLEDFRGTTFTVTIEHRNIPPPQRLIMLVECSECHEVTVPVYRQGWLCRAHAPARLPCANSTQGCTFTDVFVKHKLHEVYFCPYGTRCDVCPGTISGTTLDAHYTEAHGDVTYRNGTVFSLAAGVNAIIDCDFGKLTCGYNSSHLGPYLRLWLDTPLPSEHLYKYRCVVEISHPLTGQTVKCTPTVQYGEESDWELVFPHVVYDAFAHDDELNFKITFINIEDQPE